MASLVPLIDRVHPVIVRSTKSNKLLRLIDMMLALVRSHKYIKLVIIDTYSTLNFYYALIISIMSKLYGIPYMPVLHGGNLPYRLKHNPQLSRIIFKYSSCNISPSLYLKHEFSLAGYQSIYIPNGIYIDKYTYQERKYCKPKLLWVRAFHEIYNPQMAISVLTELSKVYPNAELCMIGPKVDSSYDTCRQLAIENGVEDKITFTGILSKEAWIRLSYEYDLFINTTNYDNMPVSIIEAMALGFPIVSTNVGGIKYLLNDGDEALLVEKNGITEMVDKIQLLLSDPELSNSLSINARNKAENFSWEIVKLRWMNLIKLSGQLF